MTAPKTMKMTASQLATSLGLRTRDYRNSNGTYDPTKITVRTDGKSDEARAALGEFIRRVVNLQVYRRKDKRVTEGNNNFFAFFHKAAFDKVSKVLPPPKPKAAPKAKKEPKGKQDTAVSLLREVYEGTDFEHDYDLHQRISDFLDKQ